VINVSLFLIKTVRMLNVKCIEDYITIVQAAKLLKTRALLSSAYRIKVTYNYHVNECNN